MTPDELQAMAARLEAAHVDTRVLVSAIDRLHRRTVELTQRATAAETEVLFVTEVLRRTETERDQWRLRWTRAQEQVGRWFGLALDGRRA